MSRRLEIGAGNNKVGDFVHTDIIKVPGSILSVICRGEELPFLDNSFDLVFLWGVFEHFSKEGAEKFLKESYRVMTLGACLEFTIPDLEVACEILVKKQIPFPDGCMEWLEGLSREENIERYAMGCIYGGQDREGMVHQWGWTKKSIEEAIKGSGLRLREINRNCYQPGTHWRCFAFKEE